MTVPDGCPLTPRQFDCLALLAAGASPQQIASEIGVSASTVGSHLSQGYGRLGARSAAQAVQIMLDAGWLDPVNTEWADERLSAAQALYHDAFDRLLALRHTDDVSQYIALIREMTHHLRAMYYEARATPPWEVLGDPRTSRRLGPAHSQGRRR